MEIIRTQFGKIEPGERFIFRHEIMHYLVDKKKFPVFLLWEKVDDIQYKAIQVIFDNRKNSPATLPMVKGFSYSGTDVYIRR